MDKLINKINQFLFRKNIILCCIILATITVLHKPLENILNNSIVKYVFGEVETVWYNDVIFGGIVIFSIIYVTNRFKNYNPSNNILSFLTLVTIVYCCYRFFYPKWNFTTFSYLPCFAYSDVSIIVCLLNLLLLIQVKTTKRVNGENALFDDEPIGETKNDELGYTVYANLLAEKISASNFEKAFSIGINGKWGMGKTSFIQLIKRKLNGENIIEINFNPWNSNSPKAIIQDFFETVQESIRPHHSSLSRLLISYSNKLVSLNDNTVTQTIQTSVSTLTGFESLGSLFDEINKALSKIDKKLIVYIDDLDRLDKDEIVEVIRLIRNTANFYNTFFVVAYDRNYVVNSLKNHNPYKQEQFLEKIFQIEISLPYFKSDIFRYKLADKLRQKFSEDFHNTFDDGIIGSPSFTPLYLNDWLESMRDVTRLANALILNFSKLKGEVVFNDFLKLETLRLKYPSVYMLLFNKTNIFLEAYSRSGETRHYRLKKIEKQYGSLSKTTENFNTILEQHLYQNCVDLSIPIHEIDKILVLLKTIFEEGFYLSHSKGSHLSVIYPSKFNRYFAYNLLEGSLSEVEFSKARTLSQNEFNNRISKWVSENLEFELRSRFMEIRNFDNSEDFEKVIKAIFYYANQKTLNPIFSSRSIVGYDGQDLLNKLDNFQNRLATHIYGEDYGEIKLNTFVKNLFTDASEPYLFEADFIRYLNKSFSETFPISKNELKEIVKGYFKAYCLKSDHLDDNIWFLFNSNRRANWISNGNSTYQEPETIPEEIISIMKEFVLNKDLDGFLYAMITHERSDKNKFSINNFVIMLFGSWADFKQILEEQNEEKWRYLNEFKQFLADFEEKNYTESVDFKFEQIPILQRASQ